MPIEVPPAVNYSGQMIALPSLSQDEPREARLQIAAEVTWATMGGATRTVAFDAGNSGLRQISSLKIDNSKSGADVTFVFPDTSETITIPAQTPLAVVPVFSNALSFYALCPNASPTDQTRFLILNYLAPPTEVKWNEAGTLTAAFSPLWTNAPQTTNIFPRGINGTLQFFTYFTAVTGAGAVVSSLGSVSLIDGTGLRIVDSYKQLRNVSGFYDYAFGGLRNGANPIARANPYLRTIQFRDGLDLYFEPIRNWDTQWCSGFARCTVP
jgi:hypothetical protein